MLLNAVRRKVFDAKQLTAVTVCVAESDVVFNGSNWGSDPVNVLDSVNVFDCVNVFENVFDRVNVFDSVNVCGGGRHSSIVVPFATPSDPKLVLPYELVVMTVVAGTPEKAFE